MKKISIVSACYNEEGNVTELYNRLLNVMGKFQSTYDWELIYIDNNSQDNTRGEIRELCRKHKNVKAIFNTRNFGCVRSPWYGLLSGNGDAVIAISADLEDPPELIVDFIRHWEQGYKIVLGTRMGSDEQGIRARLRPLWYKIIDKVSGVPQIVGFTGFGLYSREVMETLRGLKDPYPYYRGLIGELGYRYTSVPFEKKVRHHGASHISFQDNLEIALLGITNHSIFPIRSMTLLGGGLTAFFAGILIIHLICALFSVSLLPETALLYVYISLLFAMLCLFIGIVGEYILLLVRHALNRPVVVVDERLNFSDTPSYEQKHDHE